MAAPQEQAKLGTSARPLRVAVVGAGPAGFYAAEALLKSEQQVEVDLIERLPAPYGLVRYGVAPDHQKIKNVIRTFDKVAALPGLRFVGNVTVGVDVSTDDLFEHYDQTVFSVGASTDRKMGIPGEELDGSYPAVDFVGWYNGHPDYQTHRFNLDTDVAVVVGAGDVATDLTRVLLRDRDELGQSDIADAALAALKKSPVKEVVVLVRRGPAEMKLALRELQTIDEMKDVEVVVDPADIDAAAADTAGLPTPTKKKLAYLAELAHRPSSGAPRKVVFRFLRSPKELLGADGRVSQVVIERNELVASEGGSMRPKGTGELETLPAGLVLRSIGYHGVPVPGLPFDKRSGVIPNEAGRVLSDGAPLSGVYVSGWIKRGPQGLIGTNRADSIETAKAMLEDVEAGRVTAAERTPDRLLDRLKDSGRRVVDFNDWKRLDELEVSAGQATGRVRVKFTAVDEMLSALDEERASA